MNGLWVVDPVWTVGGVLAGLNAGILFSELLEGFYLRGMGLSAYLQMRQPRDRLLPPGHADAGRLRRSTAQAVPRCAGRNNGTARETEQTREESVGSRGERA
ncbi:hypothetical protein DEFR109230_13890 [Deinococcus frigens]